MKVKNESAAVNINTKVKHAVNTEYLNFFLVWRFLYRTGIPIRNYYLLAVIREVIAGRGYFNLNEVKAVLSRPDSKVTAHACYKLLMTLRKGKMIERIAPSRYSLSEKAETLLKKIDLEKQIS